MTGNGNKPHLVAWNVTKTGKNGDNGKEISRWKNCGVVWYNKKSDTFTVKLDTLPVNGELVLMKPKESEPKESEPKELKTLEQANFGGQIRGYPQY